MSKSDWGWLALTAGVAGLATAAAIEEARNPRPRTVTRTVIVRERRQPTLLEALVDGMCQETEVSEFEMFADVPDDVRDKSCWDCRHRRFGGRCTLLNKHRDMNAPACRYFR